MAESWEQARLNHRQQQAEAIAASALSLIVEHGAPALTMAAIASAAGISRQTLYRYYRDVDAVLVGVAELIASHDELFEATVAEQRDPAAQLDLIVRTIVSVGGHGADGSATLRAALPPDAREVLTRHEIRIRQLLTNVLIAGVEEGTFRSELSPSTDAPLLLGLATAASPEHAERAVNLVHRLVDVQPEENQP